jgi:hypothetical protein
MAVTENGMARSRPEEAVYRLTCSLETTGSETKNGLLLIYTFERIFNPYENGHLVTGGHFLFVSFSGIFLCLPV